MESLDQVRIGHLSSVPDHRGGDLCVKKWLWNLPRMSGKEIKVLSPRMDDLFNLVIADELPEGVERSLGLDGGKVDDGSGRGSGDLDQFESRDEGVFSDELRIQGQPRALLQRQAQGFKGRRVGHIQHRWFGCHRSLIRLDCTYDRGIAEAPHC